MAYTAIDKPTDYFNTTLYVGNGSSKTITGIPFAPDFVWIKARSAAENHVIVDKVRGANNYLMPNTTATNDTNSEFLKSFTSDGYTLGLGDRVNKASTNLVSWNWRANGQGSSNTDGSINTTYTSANTTSGCSLITYTGTGSNATVGHGLGVVPKMIIVKRLNVTSSWRIYHSSLGNTKNIILNSTAAEATSSTMWNNTSPTSTTFSLGSYDEVNGSSAPHVAYCFADVKGFSKMGSYLGNGNADGTFVYTGFSPAFIMLKQSSASGRNWEIYDSKRIGYNVANYRLPPNTGGAEETNVNIDILSNGFKARSTDADLNASGATYIFMAFAEAPFVSSTGIPTPAR